MIRVGLLELRVLEQLAVLEMKMERPESPVSRLPGCRG
jgi:hypothetical protein